MKVVVAGLVLVVTLAACDDGYGGDGDTSPTTEPTPAQVGVLSSEFDRGVLEFSAEPDPPVTDAGIVWSFAVTNTRDEPLTLTFASGQRADVVLADDGEEVYRWSEGQVFTQAVEEVTVEPDERLIFEAEGTISVEPGTYELIATLTSDPEPPPITETIDIERGD